METSFPGLVPVFSTLSGAVFPTCPGIDPTLAPLALCYRAAEQLVERLKREER